MAKLLGNDVMLKEDGDKLQNDIEVVSEALSAEIVAIRGEIMNKTKKYRLLMAANLIVTVIFSGMVLFAFLR